MIFLAVTAGFFAETLREHIADRNKEKKHIQSLVQDLKNDTTLISHTAPEIMEQVRGIDTRLPFDV